MVRIHLISILLLLTLAAPLGAAADRFYIEPADFEPGTTETLHFILENSQEYYGFQALVWLPDGLEPMRDSDGELDITLSSRAEGRNYMVNSNVLSSGALIMGTFSATHTPLAGTDGVLVDLKIAVAESFEGGVVEVTDILFISERNQDVRFDSSSAAIGVKDPTVLVDAVFADPTAKVDVYDLNGRLLHRSCSQECLKDLTPAVYLLRTGDAVRKIAVR